MDYYKYNMSKSSKKSKSVNEEFNMADMYKSVEEITSKLKSHCISHVPEKLPEDKDTLNKLFESVRDGYVELCRLREHIGTSLRDFTEVMNRMAESRAKANACAEVEQSPKETENVLSENLGASDNEDNTNNTHNVENGEKPKKKDKKKDKKDKKAKVESDAEHSDAEEKEEPKESKKKDTKDTKDKKDKKAKVESESEHSDAEEKEEPKESKKKDKKAKH